MTRCRLVFFENEEEIEEKLLSLGAEPPGVKIMVPKGSFYTIFVEGLSLKAALILKQEMLSKGGECALPRSVAALQDEKANALLCGTLRQFTRLAQRLRGQYFGLPELAWQLDQAIADNRPRPRTLKFKSKTFNLGERTLIMGVLNVTPDSFSDGGKFYDRAAAIEQALKLVEHGADIVDIGGESTRPGHEAISTEEEIERVIPVIKALREAAPAVPISIDTYKSAVARAALAAGAEMLNDIWGGRRDPAMLDLAASAGLPICLMHNKDHTRYDDLLSEIVAVLKDCASRALAAGVAEENIVLDPGIGFGKNAAQNLAVMRHLREITSLRYPILLGTSRKSTIGKVLNLPVDQRQAGTAATVAHGIACGVEIVRVHDLPEMQRVARMTDAICRGGNFFAE